MNAEELKAIVDSWPEDAWPHAVMQIGKCWHVDTLPVPLETAAALFRDSGLKWLMERHPEIHLHDRRQDCAIRYIVAWGNHPGTEYFDGPDWLSCISAAIKRERGEHGQ